MIPRYTPDDFLDLWSDQTRFDAWLEVELAACEAMESANIVPHGTAATIRGKGLALDAREILEIEKTTRHGVIAFLTHIEQLAGDPAPCPPRRMPSRTVPATHLPRHLAPPP